MLLHDLSFKELSTDVLFSSGFDSDGQIKSTISFIKFGETSKFKSKFEFEVKRAGNDPMVEMELCDDRSQWGLDCVRFQVTNSDIKVIKQVGF